MSVYTDMVSKASRESCMIWEVEDFEPRLAEEAFVASTRGIF
jgi:hypothetical protein